MGRWTRYWFDDGGRLALACVRIAVATAVALTLVRIADVPGSIVAPAAVYRPVGIWMLFGAAPPPPALVWALWGVAWAGTIAMGLGLLSRLATVVSFLGSIALAAVVFSGKATWSHQFNVVLLAQLALVGGRVGDTLSLDALIRRVRGLPPANVPRGYQWSLRLAQLAVALMFVSAAFYKLAQGHFTLRWALSDSLRHHLLVRFDLAGIERPPVAEWLIDHVWRYRTAALLNFVSQLAPLAAVIFVRRPLVRAAAGAFFVVETLSLGLVVDLWNVPWFPLVAVFVDWERLVTWLARRPVPVPVPAPAAVPAGWRRPHGPHAFLIGFVAYHVLCLFVPRLAQRLNTYPFTSFPMFSQIRANPPYDEHRSYAVPGDRFEALTEHGTPPMVQYALDHVNRGLYTAKTGAEVRARLTTLLAQMSTRFPDLGWRGLRHRVVLFVAPAYPASARFDAHDLAITGEAGSDGTVRTVLGVWGDRQIELDPRGVDLGAARSITFSVYEHDHEVPRALAARRTGPTRWELEPVAADPAYLVVTIDGTPWLAAWRRAWQWGK